MWLGSVDEAVFVSWRVAAVSELIFMPTSHLADCLQGLAEIEEPGLPRELLEEAARRLTVYSDAERDAERGGGS